MCCFYMKKQDVLSILGKGTRSIREHLLEHAVKNEYEIMTKLIVQMSIPAKFVRLLISGSLMPHCGENPREFEELM